jgi:hypothetical protein
MDKEYCGYRNLNVRESTKSGRSRKGNAQKPKKAHSRRSCFGTGDVSLNNTSNCRKSSDTKRCVVKSDDDVKSDQRRALVRSRTGVNRTMYGTRAKYGTVVRSKTAKSAQQNEEIELLPNPGLEGGRRRSEDLLQQSSRRSSSENLLQQSSRRSSSENLLDQSDLLQLTGGRPTAQDQIRAQVKATGVYQRGQCLDAPDEATCHGDDNCHWIKESKDGKKAHCGAKSGVRKGDKVYEGPMLPYHTGYVESEQLLPNPGLEGGRPTAAEVRAAQKARGSYQSGDCVGADEQVCRDDPSCLWVKGRKDGQGKAYCRARSGHRKGTKTYTEARPQASAASVSDGSSHDASMAAAAEWEAAQAPVFPERGKCRAPTQVSCENDPNCRWTNASKALKADGTPQVKAHCGAKQGVRTKKDGSAPDVFQGPMRPM